VIQSANFEVAAAVQNVNRRHWQASADAGSRPADL